MIPRDPMYKPIPEELTETPLLFYKSGYKYISQKDFIIKMGFAPEKDIITTYGIFTKEGWIIIWAFYGWDGASGPTYDSKNSMVGSQVHDFLYQLMRDGKLSRKFRKKSDLAIYYLIRRDGMSWFRAKYWYRGVRIGARKATLPESSRKVLIAP